MLLNSALLKETETALSVLYGGVVIAPPSAYAVFHEVAVVV
jgi:hypothetical protein